jgi:hypothetical protein
VSAIALALCLSINLTCDQEMDQPQQFQTTQSLPAESGHWPAPRSKFLIDAPAAVSTAPATTSEPKVTARKLPARRVVGKKAFTKKVATQDATAAKNSAFVVQIRSASEKRRIHHCIIMLKGLPSKQRAKWYL